MTILIDNNAPAVQRSAADLAALKANWRADPCWDIEDTEGFEAHQHDLYTYRLEIENAELRAQLAEIRAALRTVREFAA